MADLDVVRTAVAEAVVRVEELEDDTRRKIPDRSISVLVTDLDLAWAGRFERGHLVDVTEIDPAQARSAAFRLRMPSDVLVDLIEDRISFGTAWSKGRLRVDAGFRDVLSLRAFL